MRLLPRLTLALSLFVAAPASRAGGLATAPATPLARDFFLSELARDLSAHFNLE
ncbi:MAG: hypothetical protein QG602_265, partial [Verrucomicrobiota bacterium]|nr:hypothetical protein [Verrucomicrobiota bacterium]